MKRAICILATLGIWSAVSAADGLYLTKVAIDAGHGGSDPGAVSKDRRTFEKDLTLDISRKLSRRIMKAYPQMDVRLTRTDDSFVSLADRADRANRWGSQLFISIHINSTRSTTPCGYSVHVLGESSNKDRDLFAYNMDVCKRENSVILLEDDYSTKYQGFDPTDPESVIFMQLMQNSHLEQSLDFAQYVSEGLVRAGLSGNRGIWQNPFYVLWRTAMPSVLVELGFISNSADLAVLRSEARRDSIAACLFKAFSIYKEKYDGSVTTPGDAAQGKTEVTSPGNVRQGQTPAPSGEDFYGVQIFAGSTLLSSSDKSFLGYKPAIVKVGKIYKYVIGLDKTIEGAKKNKLNIRKKYPNAFIVRLSKDTKTQSYTMKGVL